MLAGYLRDIEEDAGWGIPFLRDIPIIGWLFGGKSTRKETVQRVFVVTPHIVDLDQEMLYRLQATRLRDISIGEDIQRDTEEEEAERNASGEAVEPDGDGESAVPDNPDAPELPEAGKASALPDGPASAEAVEVPELPEIPAPPEEGGDAIE